MPRRTFLTVVFVSLFILAAIAPVVAVDESVVLDFSNLTVDDLAPEEWSFVVVPLDWDQQPKPAKSLAATSYIVPIGAQERGGESVMRVTGTLHADAQMVDVRPSRPIPSGDDVGSYNGNGVLTDVGPIRSIQVTVANLGEPVWLSLRFEDDQGNYFDASFLIAGALTEDPFCPTCPPPDPEDSLAWVTHLFVNPMADIQARYQKESMPHIRLVGFTLESGAHRDVYEQHYRIASRLTNAERIRWEESNPLTFGESHVDLLIATVVVEHGVW